jgi:hypothetical protein
LSRGVADGVRLHETGGKEHDIPCHHRLDQYLHDYIEAAGISDEVDAYLFRSGRRTASSQPVPFSSKVLIA